MKSQQDMGRQETIVRPTYFHSQAASTQFWVSRTKASPHTTTLQHHNPNPTPRLVINIILCIDTTRNRIRIIVIQIIMQLSISGTEFLVLQEQGIVKQGEGIEDIELVLLGDDECVIDEFVEALFKISAGVGRVQGVFRGVVEEVGCADSFVLGVVDDGGFEDVEGEEVG